MRELVLLRHAKAEAAGAGQGDRARALIDRGRRDALAAGRALKEWDVAADVVLASPSARTLETARLVTEAAGLPGLKTIEALYHAEAEVIWAEAMASGGDRVLIVGHNPGLHELAILLTRQAHDRSRAALDVLEGFPTASFAHFAIEGETLEAAGPRLIAAWRASR